MHFKGQGLAKHRQYWHDVIGYNYRMTNICAAIGLAQLENIEQVINEKKRVAETYKLNLSNTPVIFHDQKGNNIYHSFWMCSILTSDAKERDALRFFLEKFGIETRPLFYPVHTMPMYSEEYHRHPVAENIGWRGINLPSYPGLKKNEIDFICRAIKEFYK
jgi:perosamine synthetase